MLVNTAGLKTVLNAIKEYIRRQIGRIKRPDWNQNDESAQDYIKNRTHWKSEGNERYKRVPLRTILRGHDLLVYIGDRAFVGAFDAQFQEYPFAILATSNDAYFSQIHLNSLNYKSLSLMDASGRIVAKKDLTQAKENKTSDKLISYVVMLEGDDRIPLRDEYNNGYKFTVVLETKTTYHKISQEYLPENVLYSSKQSLTEEQQEQARENITVTKSYQIPTTTINDDKVQVDGWAAAPIGIGRPSGFSIILSDVLNGALPFFVANGTVFLCTGVDSSGAHKVLTFVGFASSDLSAIAYKNARWEDGLTVIHIYPGSVNPNDIEECAQTEYFYVGPYGYIYGRHYEELAGDNPKVNIPRKYPFAVVDGKFNNAVLPLFAIYEESKQIAYVRTDSLPNGAFKIQGLIVGDMNAPFEIVDIDMPVYIKPYNGIPKIDLADDVQTSLAKADTAISLGLTTATPGQIIKVKTVQDGEPTEWEAVDMPSGGVEWYEVIDMETTENVNDLIISADKNGRPISGYHALEMVLCFQVPADSTQTSDNGSIWVYPMSSDNLSSGLRIIANVATWKTIARNNSYFYAGSNRATFVSGATNGDTFDGSYNNVFDGIRLYIHSAGDHLPAGTKVRCLVLSKGWTA